MSWEKSILPPGEATVSARAEGRRRPAAGGEALRGLCEEFEAVFIKQIMKAAGVCEAPEGTGYGMPGLDACGELARALSQKRCLGIADALYARFSHRLPGEGS